MKSLSIDPSNFGKLATAFSPRAQPLGPYALAASFSGSPRGSTRFSIMDTTKISAQAGKAH